MRRLYVLALLVVVCAAAVTAQTWAPVWKMTVAPYLTLPDITEMGIVKAGFDTDNDGWGEFLCSWTDLDTNVVLMYEATADNSYQLVWSWIIPIPISSYAPMAVGDVNNNGVVDIVVGLPSVVGTDANPLRLFFFEWNGVTGKNDYGIKDNLSGLFTYSGGYNLGVVDNYDLRPFSMSVEDMDGDGKNELVTGIRQATPTTVRAVYVVSVDGDFSGFYFCEVKWKFQSTFGGSNYSTTTGDLDNDGKKEIYMFVWNNFTMRIFECKSDTSYTQAFAVDQFAAGTGVDHGALDAVRVTDVNNDGMKEMYIASTEPVNEVYIVTGVTDVSTMTTANIKRLYTVPKTGGGKFRSMFVADPDHDGRQELMIGGETNGQIFSLEYKGTGDPADSANWNLQVIFDIWKESGNAGLTPRLFYGSPAGDMDKDGKDEYVFVNYAPDYEVWAEDVPLWVIEMTSTTDVRDESAPVPESVGLMQNYPNPFNPSTTIPFMLSSRSKVKLEVFNVYGEHVATLVDGEREAGVYQARWTATVPSGTYFTRLSVEPLEGKGGAVLDVKKMLLLK